MKTESSFFADAQNRFKGCTREVMKGYAELLGVDIKGGLSDENLTARLCAAIGEIAPVSKAAPAAAKEAPRPTEKPNLTTIGRWGGKCHDVTLFRPVGDNAPGVPLRWDEMLIYVPFGDGKQKYTISEPHFEILKNAILRTFTSAIKSRDDGSKFVEKIDHETQAFPFQDHGVTPGTENLPSSLLEWYQWEAERKDYFKRFKLSRLESIYSELSGLPPVTRVSPTQVTQWDRERCLAEVLRFLGPTYFAQLDDSEIDTTLEELA